MKQTWVELDGRRFLFGGSDHSRRGTPLLIGRHLLGSGVARTFGLSIIVAPSADFPFLASPLRCGCPNSGGPEHPFYFFLGLSEAKGSPKANQEEFGGAAFGTSQIPWCDVKEQIIPSFY